LLSWAHDLLQKFANVRVRVVFLEQHIARLEFLFGHAVRPPLHLYVRRVRHDERREGHLGVAEADLQFLDGLMERNLRVSRYSHARMEAKRRALEEIAPRQRAADEKRREKVERQQQGAAPPPVATVQ